MEPSPRPKLYRLLITKPRCGYPPRLGGRRDVSHGSSAINTSSNYLAIVRGLRELHQLRPAGREDSAEADAVRDATDTAWEGLTKVEKKRLSGLSEDLYSVSDPERPTFEK